MNTHFRIFSNFFFSLSCFFSFIFLAFLAYSTSSDSNIKPENSSTFSENSAATIYCPAEQGHCVDEKGEEVHKGVKIINVDFSSANDDVSKMGQLCLEACFAKTEVTGCMWHPGERICGTHSKNVASGDDNSEFQCWVFSKCENAYVWFG